MADPTPGQSATQMLQRQLDELGSLYNAGVRSPNFREWRQNTLTCIQRIFPAEPARPERFRRIPFSPPMGRPDERAIREYFERGCGEAATLLKDYIAEIATVGIAQPGAGIASAPPTPGEKDDDFPTRELPGPSAAAAPGAAKVPAAPSKPRLKDMLGFTDAAEPPVAPQGQTADAGAPPLPQAAPPAGAAAAPVAPAPPQPAQPPIAAGALPVPRAPAQPPAGVGAPPLPQRPTPTPAPPAAPATPARTDAPIILTGSAALTPTAPPVPTVPPAPPAAPAPPALPPGHQATGAAAPDDLERVADELLRASSALSSLPRPGTPERRSTPRDVRSPIPLAIAALALEVESLGVPEGHRARARAVLLDLSRNLEAPNLSWETLRGAMNFVMEFPALGRRMMPLLLPFFDRAA